VLERTAAVHLGNDERDARLEPVGGRLVDRDRAAAHCVWHELTRRGRADREERDIELPGGEGFRRRLLDDELALAEPHSAPG
jgi:hypothetical protein